MRHRVMQNLLAPCGVVEDSSYAMEVLSDTPFCYWQCQDTSGDMTDSAGLGHDKPLTFSSNPPTYRVTGPLTSACDKAMSRSAETLAIHFPIIDTSVDDISFEMWIYRGEASSADREIWRNGAADTNGWGVYLKPTGEFYYITSAGNVGSDSTALTQYDWSHIVVVRDSGTWSYYINGSVDVSNAGTDTPSTPASANTFMNVGKTCEMWAHVAYYTTALSSTQVADHYAAR